MLTQSGFCFFCVSLWCLITNLNVIEGAGDCTCYVSGFLKFHHIMKLKILFFAVLLPLLSFSQGVKFVPGELVIRIDTVPADGSLNMDVNRVTVWDGGAWAKDPEPLTFLGQKVKCKCETIRDTTVHNEGSATCAHDWVLAAYEDVNAPKYPRVTLAVYRPCPDNEITNYGRVCSKCLRHEIEHVMENWAVDHEKSKYRQLVEQSEKKQ